MPICKALPHFLQKSSRLGLEGEPGLMTPAVFAGFRTPSKQFDW